MYKQILAILALALVLATYTQSAFAARAIGGGSANGGNGGSGGSAGSGGNGVIPGGSTQNGQGQNNNGGSGVTGTQRPNVCNSANCS